MGKIEELPVTRVSALSRANVRKDSTVIKRNCKMLKVQHVLRRVIQRYNASI